MRRAPAAPVAVAQRPARARVAGAALAACAAPLLLAGCVVGPDAARPSLPSGANGAFVETARRPVAGGALPPVSAMAPVPGAWWRLYAVPALDRLVGEALTHNTDLRVAAATLARARAVLSETRGARLPSTDPSASYTRRRIGTGSTPATAAIPGAPAAFVSDLFSLGFDASYEVDLFGGVARAVEAARGDAAAAEAQLDAARVAVAAETARDFVAVCSDAAEVAVARDSVRLQQRTLELTRTLAEAGRGTLRDVDRADVLLAQTQAQIPMIEAERRAALYALATMTGRPPADLDAGADDCLTPPRLATLIPVGDGAALLARRPDVRAAERTLAADTARIGVATAALYPSITLLGAVTLGAAKPGDLGKSASLSYSLGPMISWSFPNQTIARARLREARAGADLSLARFDAAVLTALREVEQALARYGGALQRNAALRRAEASSTAAAKLSQLRFAYGADNFLLLIEAERDRTDARAALAASDAAVADAQISLFKALGGGWQDAPAATRLTSR